MNKLIILLLLPTLFAVSCGTKADNIETKPDIDTDINSKAQTKLSPTPKPSKQDINQKVGIVDGHIEDICLRTKNDNLTKNTNVSIVTELNSSPQKVLNAAVKKKLQKSCSRRASESFDKNPGENFYYSLTSKDKEVDEYQEVSGIGVIEPEKSFRIQNDLATIDLNNDGKADFFRKCTSFEGMIFTIWTGKPLKGKQIWYSFYYLDYGTVPDCKEKDREIVNG